ncbi:hypothetical protein EUGRSUZ_F02748 [Eucalyptus grandis]|uniref:Uncharacterized protein n=2 Tax=Eucalyptus grandis TaxID=71139 RepID=A0A059BUC1_EUCGR|nr:hypothetical protein EUGRSUZ_F02748 [Eucalyptus grandis]
MPPRTSESYARHCCSITGHLYFSRFVELIFFFFIFYFHAGSCDIVKPNSVHTLSDLTETSYLHREFETREFARDYVFLHCVARHSSSHMVVANQSHLHDCWHTTYFAFM